MFSISLAEEHRTVSFIHVFKDYSRRDLDLFARAKNDEVKNLENDLLGFYINELNLHQEAFTRCLNPDLQVSALKRSHQFAILGGNGD